MFLSSANILDQISLRGSKPYGTPESHDLNDKADKVTGIGSGKRPLNELVIRVSRDGGGLLRRVDQNGRHWIVPRSKSRRDNAIVEIRGANGEKIFKAIDLLKSPRRILLRGAGLLEELKQRRR